MFAWIRTYKEVQCVLEYKRRILPVVVLVLYCMYVYVLQSKEEYSPVTTVLKAVKLVHVTNMPCLRMSKFTLSSLIILSKDSHGTICSLTKTIMIAPIDFL